MKIKKEHFFFVGILLLVCSVCSFGKYLHYPPFSIHQWAQADRASVALTYYYSGMDFFHPRTLSIMNGTGITGVEFPGFYYIIAVLYKVFGPSDFIFRFTNLLISLCGLFFLNKLFFRFFKKELLSISASLLVFLSPVFLYYSFNFLPDSTSFSLSVIAWYFLETYIETKKWKYFLVFTLCSLLSILLKVYFGVFYISLGIAVSISFLRANLLPLWKKADKYKVLLVLILNFVIASCWYVYSQYLNDHYKSGVFLMSTKMPADINEWWSNILSAGKMWGHDFMSPLSIITILICVIQLIWGFTRGRVSFYAIWLLTYTIGVISFYSLFSVQFVHHDYYWFILFPLFILLLISVVPEWQKTIMSRSKSRFIIIALIILGLYNLWYGRNILIERYTLHCPIEKLSDLSLNELTEIAKLMREKGIPENSKVIVFYDLSPNIALYLLKCQGVGINYLWPEDYVEYVFHTTRPEYIVSVDGKYPLGDFFYQIRGEKVIEGRNVVVYKCSM